MLQRWGEECCCVRQRAWWCHGLTLIAWYQGNLIACGAKKLQLPQWLCDPTEVTQRGQCKTCRWLYRWVHLNVILVITLTHYNFCFYKPTNRNAAWKTKYHRWRVNVTRSWKPGTLTWRQPFNHLTSWNHVHDAVSILMETGNGLQSL